MKHSLMLWGAVSLLFSGTAAVSALVFYSVLPNTDDDSALEYIEVFNPTCSGIVLSWVSIQDASGKLYTFTWGILESGQVRRVSREESKIALNNTDESLVLLDSSGNQLDSVRYAVSTRNTAIEWKPVMALCPGDTVEETVVEEVIEHITETGSLMGTGSDFQFESIPIEIQITPPTTLPVQAAESSGAFLSGATAFSWETILSWSTVFSGGIFLSGSTFSSGEHSASWTVFHTGAFVSTGAGVFHAGTVVSMGTGVLSGSVTQPTEPLKAERMILMDTDSNGRLDTVIISYWGMLSGVLNTAGLFISSASGGLASFPIDTSSWVVREASYSGSELHIALFEQNIIHPDLKINNTSKSHFRLKSSSVLWLTDLFGLPVAPLTLTQSFDEYDPSRIENRMISPTVVSNIAGQPLNTPSSVQVTVTYPPQLSQTQTPKDAEIAQESLQPLPSVWSGNAAVPSPILRILPDPIIRIQSWVESNGRCSREACSVNAMHPVSEKFELCRWEFLPLGGTGALLTGCNPRSFRLWRLGGWIRLVVSDKSGLLAEKQSVLIIHPFQSESGENEDENVSKQSTSRLASFPSLNQTSTLLLSWTSDILVHDELQEVGSSKKKSQKISAAATANWSKVPSLKVSTQKTPTIKKTTKTTTKKTAVAKSSLASKNSPDLMWEEKTMKKQGVIASSKKSDPISDSAVLWIVWIACAWIWFGLSFIRKRPDEEPVG